MKYIITKAILVTVSAFFIVAAPFLYSPYESIAVSSGNIVSGNNLVILDAGHGGEDGGAIGVGGILEKDLNLAITLKTAKFFEFLGYKIEYTRETDTMTCDEGLKTQHQKKVSDIKNRLSQIENSSCLCVVSIHQNIFGGDVQGAQVFYSPNAPESKDLALALQNGVAALLQPGNTRVIKPATKDIYLFYHVTKPAVIVECGFISNSAEAALLSDDSYQNKMAFAVAVSTVNYLTEREV